MHRALVIAQTQSQLAEDDASEMETDYLRDFSEKWQLNRKTVKVLESNNIVLEEDFLDLSDADIENLGLTIGQKNALKRGIAIVRMSATMSAECGEDIAKHLSNSMTNMSFYSCPGEDLTDYSPEEMGFIKSMLYLGLRYIFLGLLIGYHTLAKLWHTLLAPFEPIREAANKVPEDEVSVGGIISTVKRLAFIFLLVWATMIKSVLDRVMQPVYNIVENMSDFVERHTPPSKLEKVE